MSQQEYFRKNRVHGAKFSYLLCAKTLCENHRRNNNLTSWKRNVKISWNYHENNFTWGEIVASIDKKQINSYDLTKHVLQLHACFSRDFFLWWRIKRGMRREDFSFHRVGKFSLREHSVFPRERSEERKYVCGSRARLRKVWLELSVSFAGFSESFHSRLLY